MLYALLACSLKTAIIPPPAVSAEVTAIGIAATHNDTFGRQMSHGRAAQSLHFLLTPEAHRFARLKRGTEEHTMILQQGTVHPFEPEYHLLGENKGQNKTWQATLKQTRTPNDFKKIAALNGYRIRLFEASTNLGMAQELSTKKAIHRLINDAAERQSLGSEEVLMGSITIIALEHTVTPTGVWTDLVGHISFKQAEDPDRELAMLHLDYATSEEKKGKFKLAERSYDEAATLQPEDEAVVIATAEYHWRRENIEQSINLYLNVLEKDPSNYDLMEKVISRCKSAKNRGGECYERIRSLIPKVEKPPEPVEETPQPEANLASEKQSKAAEFEEDKPEQQPVKVDPSSEPDSLSESELTTSTEAVEPLLGDNPHSEKNEQANIINDEPAPIQESGASNTLESERAKLIQEVKLSEENGQNPADEITAPVNLKPAPSESAETEN